MRNEEFYIGWMDKAPSALDSFLKKYTLLLAVLVAGISVLLATGQKKFRDGVFEYGTLTTVSGIYAATPVPHLLAVQNGEAVFIPLVGYGKHGAGGILEAVEKEKGVSLNQKRVRLRGTLIHGEGKTLLQVSKAENPVLEVSDETAHTQGATKAMGTITLSGEVIDPKCYFGVMKPGEGKVHKDCAIRCLSGGIPPVLMTTNERGERSFVLLVGANGEKLNDAVRDFVAVPSQVSGELVQYSNWAVMHVNSMRNAFAVYGERLSANEASSCCRPAAPVEKH